VGVVTVTTIRPGDYANWFKIEERPIDPNVIVLPELRRTEKGCEITAYIAEHHVIPVGRPRIAWRGCKRNRAAKGRIFPVVIHIEPQGNTNLVNVTGTTDTPSGGFGPTQGWQQ